MNVVVEIIVLSCDRISSLLDTVLNNIWPMLTTKLLLQLLS